MVKKKIQLTIFLTSLNGQELFGKVSLPTPLLGGKSSKILKKYF